MNPLRKRLKQIRHWSRVNLRYQYGVKDLIAVHQIAALPVANQGAKSEADERRYTAEGVDPYFRMRLPLPAGWYMAEVRMQVPDGKVDARFYLDLGHGESEEAALGLPVFSGRMVKRLVYLPTSGRLRFDPMDREGEFSLKHFRLVRMPDRMARSRLHKKLASQLSAYQQSGVAAQTLEQRWCDYNSLFERQPDEAVSYARWIEEVEAKQIPDAEAQKAAMNAWSRKPTISVLVPTYNTPEPLLRACLDSVLAQTYPHWELCIADDASTNPSVHHVLEAYAAQDARIKLVRRTRNGHISECSNSALALATGDFVALLDHDDLLPAHALFTVAQSLQKHPTAKIIYSDEDKLDRDGQRCSPFFKPDWSPDLLYSQNYMNHLMVYQRQLVEQVGGFRKGYEGSQDYDLLLRSIVRVPSQADIVHIPQVLYHWRMAEGSTALGHGQKDYATAAALRALQEHMNEWHPGVRMEVTQPGIYRHRWPLPAELPLVSLIIPTRDGLEHLRKCIESIREKTTYLTYEILVVDNQSSCPETLDYMRRLENDAKYEGRVRVLRYDHPFNYSAINNFAARLARGTVLGLVNNDVEVISGEWLSEMVSHALRPEIGCVGAKLYYPDGTLQHAGVVLGIGGVAGHSHKYFLGTSDGYFGRLWTIHDVSAVTGAALIVRKSVFERARGLDEKELRVAFNDVDFCIRVRQFGLFNLWTPFAEMYHHESKTRGNDNTPEKSERFQSECRVMHERWGNTLKNDCFYNKNLTLLYENYSLSTDTPAFRV